jgi:hypothetical protein
MIDAMQKVLTTKKFFHGNPGILINGHDLKDMEELLRQIEDTGIDVYTHGERLPANYDPAFKKYDHFVGNYGGSWWHQNKDFESFNGPILLTTNCLVPLKKNNTYLDRLFTTGVVGYEGAVHIGARPEGGTKDFSALIKKAKTCPPSTEIETGTIVGGFAHHQVLALADKIVDAVKSGAVKRFVFMAGCDGRHKTRNYYTEVTEKLPKETVILTAGWAKYRYNKLALDDIGGIPRVLEPASAMSYSLALIALKLERSFWPGGSSKPAVLLSQISKYFLKQIRRTGRRILTDIFFFLRHHGKQAIDRFFGNIAIDIHIHYFRQWIRSDFGLIIVIKLYYTKFFHTIFHDGIKGIVQRIRSVRFQIIGGGRLLAGKNLHGIVNLHPADSRNKDIQGLRSSLFRRPVHF